MLTEALDVTSKRFFKQVRLQSSESNVFHKLVAATWNDFS